MSRIVCFYWLMCPVVPFSFFFYLPLLKRWLLMLLTRWAPSPHRSHSGCLPCTVLWITGETAARPLSQSESSSCLASVNLYLAFESILTGSGVDNNTESKWFLVYVFFFFPYIRFLCGTVMQAASLYPPLGVIIFPESSLGWVKLEYHHGYLTLKTHSVI